MRNSRKLASTKLTDTLVILFNWQPCKNWIHVKKKKRSITHNTKPASLISTGHEDLEKKLVLMQIWFRKTWLQKCSQTSIKQWQLCNKLEESIQRASTNQISRNKVIDRQIHYLLVTRLSFYISGKKITYRLVILGQ